MCFPMINHILRELVLDDFLLASFIGSCKQTTTKNKPIDNLDNLQDVNPIEYTNLINNKSNNYEYPAINSLKQFILILKSNRFLYFSLI